MKKTACMLLAVLFLCLPFACGAPEPAATPVPSAEPTQEAALPTEDAITVITTPEVTLPPAPTLPPTPVPTPTPVPLVESDPVITLVGGEDYTCTADFTFTDPGFYAVDWRQNSLSNRVAVTGEVVSYLVGSYDLTYTVTDDDGRTATVVRHVSVVPAEMPEVVMPPEKTVYLTFDDGPCGNTEQLLAVLKKYDAKATFFVIGNKTRTDLIKRAYEEGHSIGVHTYTHVYKSIYKSEQAFFEDFLKTQEVIKEATGSYTRIFRFPGGSGNTASRRNKGIMTRLAKIMVDMGYQYFDWNVTGGDSEKGSTTESVKKRVITGLKNHSDFAIVLQHDIHIQSVRAVESILKWGTEHGYTFRALDLTSPVVHSKIQN
ncbi:MAG: polysaccharide deacetylase family protein [Clostridia bacterium]|nr:polysaccharide deacetylase family protein [Clostridia bacterium]